MHLSVFLKKILYWYLKGCDASLLLDGSNSEKDAPPNLTVRGYDLIDAVKIQLEKTCPGVVSCADIIAMATRDVVNWVSCSSFIYTQIFLPIHTGNYIQSLLHCTFCRLEEDDTTSKPDVEMPSNQPILLIFRGLQYLSKTQLQSSPKETLALQIWFIFLVSTPSLFNTKSTSFIIYF